jgi:hypothetical protein
MPSYNEVPHLTERGGINPHPDSGEAFSTIRDLLRMTGKRSNKSGCDNRIGSWARYSASKKGASTLDSDQSRMRRTPVNQKSRLSKALRSDSLTSPWSGKPGATVVECKIS